MSLKCESNDQVDAIKMLLITANVGTVFENLEEMLDIWLNEIINKISELKPDFVALHFQEMGGKNYKQSMQSVDIFYKKFLGNSVIKTYNRYLILIDSDFTDDLKFTSLSNVYLINQSLADNDVELYNFNDKSFFKFQSRQIFSGNLKFGNFFHKERFEKSLFKEFQWSRKGFLQTKWRIRNNIFSLLNVHLFHDASNLIAMKSSPSIYSENRKKAFNYTLEQIEKNKTSNENDDFLAAFGDFNFRLDLGLLLDNYTDKSQTYDVKDENNKFLKTVYNHSNKKVFTIEDKKFKWHKQTSIKEEMSNLLKFDKELQSYSEELSELNITFPPSYPFMEDSKNSEKYMESRCPAWCDRVIMNKKLNNLIKQDSVYDMIGKQTCMGDHKPIYLYFTLTKQSMGDNHIHQNSNNNFNYVYINYNLSKLEQISVDIHDNAWFNSINSLNCSSNFTKNYEFNILNLNEQMKDSQLCLNKSSEFKCKFKQEIHLNKWLNSIAELIVLKSKTSCSNKAECNCVIQFVNLTESNIIKFFQLSLHSNFFKLKHLLTYLDKMITYLKIELGFKLDINNNNNDFELSLNDLTNCFFFDVSYKSLAILNEIRSFLTTSCCLSIFKLALQKSNSSKKLTIYTNFFN